MEDALIEVATMRGFAGIALITDRIPYETTILPIELESDDSPPPAWRCLTSESHFFAKD